MKKKTKLLTMLIAIFVMGMTMSVFAADKTTLTTIISGDTSSGGEITVKVDMSGSANLGGLQSAITYDKTKLQYVSGVLTDEFTTSATIGSSDVVENENGVGMAVAFNNPSNYNGIIAELKFKVLADKGEEVEVNLTSELADINYNEMAVEDKPAKFTVKIPMTSIAIEGETDRTMVKGDSITLKTVISPDNTTETNKNVKWTSSNDKVAKVDAHGVVTAVGGGKAVITATTEVGGLTAKANISVNVKLTGIDIKTSAKSLEEGKSLQLSVVAIPEDTTEKVSEVEWLSSDENIAKVDDKGVVTAVKAGDVKITAKAAGFTKEITIKVTVKAEQKPEETQKVTEKTTTADTVKEDATVDGESKTGDTFNPGIVLVIMLVSIAIVGVTVFGKKNVVEE